MEGIVGSVIFGVIYGFIVAGISSSKGQSFFKGFLLGFFLGLVAVIITLISLPDLNKEKVKQLKADEAYAKKIQQSRKSASFQSNTNLQTQNFGTISVVNRRPFNMGKSVKVNVFINDQKTGTLGRGEEVAFQVPSGECVVYIQKWGKSNCIGVKLEPNQTVRLRVHSTHLGFLLNRESSSVPQEVWHGSEQTEIKPSTVTNGIQNEDETGKIHQSPSIRFCNYCGIKLEQGVRYCTACGTPIPDLVSLARPSHLRTIPPQISAKPMPAQAPSPSAVVQQTAMATTQPTVSAQAATDNTNFQQELSEIKSALAVRDIKKAGLLMDRILKQDFANPAVWELLYQLLGNGEDFSVFQQEFALKYYPNKVHLLSNSSLDKHQ